MHTVTENETWELVDVLKDIRPIGCRGLYKVKYKINNSVNRYKAQLVPKGYMMKKIPKLCHN